MRTSITDSYGFFFRECLTARPDNAGLQQISGTFVACDLLNPQAFPTQSLQTNTLA